MFCTETGKLLVLLFTLVLTTGLTACGQKGDLYHPEDKQATAVDHTRHT